VDQQARPFRNAKINELIISEFILTFVLERSTSDFGGRHLGFQQSLTRKTVAKGTITLGEPENLLC
jgi:hypothetical protein